MYYGKKKKIILIVVILLVVLLLGAGVLGFLILKTDLFKSNKTLFCKYAMQEIDKFDISSNKQIEAIEDLKTQIPYHLTGTLKASSETDEYSFIDKLQLNIDSKVNNREEKLNTNLKVVYNNNNLVVMDFAKTNDTYAIKWEEIVAQYFVGIKNENLKVLAQKLDIANTDMIPDSIEIDNNLNEIFKISDQEKNNIKETYLSVLINNIPENKFSKQDGLSLSKNGNSFKATAYRVDLTRTDIKNLEIKLLETLKQDSITLNLIVNKVKLIGKQDFSINDLVKAIDEQINSIMTTVDTNTNGVSIMVYEANGENVLTEILLQNEAKITINEATEKTKTITVLDLSGENEFDQITFTINKQIEATSSMYKITVNQDNKKIYDLSITNTGSAEQSNLQTAISFAYDEKYYNSMTESGIVSSNTTEPQEINFKIDYTQTIIFGNLSDEITELTNQNCAILNNYPKESLQALMRQIVEKVSQVVTSKVQYIAADVIESVSQEALKAEIESFNNTFTTYEGEEKLGSQVKILCEVVKESNKVNETNTSKQVMVILDNELGISSSTEIDNLANKIDPNKTYDVEMIKNEKGFITGVRIKSK